MRAPPFAPRGDHRPLDAVRDLAYVLRADFLRLGQALAAGEASRTRALEEQPVTHGIVAPKPLHEPPPVASFLMNRLQPRQAPRTDLIARLRAVGGARRRQRVAPIDELPQLVTTSNPGLGLSQSDALLPHKLRVLFQISDRWAVPVF